MLTIKSLEDGASAIAGTHSMKHRSQPRVVNLKTVQLTMLCFRQYQEDESLHIHSFKLYFYSTNYNLLGNFLSVGESTGKREKGIKTGIREEREREREYGLSPYSNFKIRWILNK